MLELEEIYPPFGLAIECGPVSMRVMRDDDFPELVELIQGGVASPAFAKPFTFAWNEVPFGPGEPGRFPATSLTHWWGARAKLTPDTWTLQFVVRRDGVLVGVQDVMTSDYHVTRSGTTGSWLGTPHHGKGTGTMMRQMMATLMFDHLGAVEMLSEYVEGNHASAGVSRKTGYQPNGQHRDASASTGVVHGIRLTPETFIRPEADVVVTGAEAVRRFLGIDGIDG